jgi:hypothetical protein
MKIPPDFDRNVFDNVTVRDDSRANQNIYSLFEEAIRKARQCFLSSRRRDCYFDVQNFHGAVVPCRVELCLENPEQVNIWPCGEAPGGPPRQVPIDRGTNIIAFSSLFKKCLLF